MTEQQVKEENMMAERIARKLLGAVVPEFGIGGVPVNTAAKVFGKSELWVKEGIAKGILPIGTFTESEPGSKRNFYISPKLLWEYTGYVWKGREAS